jgi:hypothetical protein
MNKITSEAPKKASVQPKTSFMLDKYNCKNKFFLFCSTQYYPLGGWCDFKGSFYTVKDALLYLKMNIDEYEKEWYHIIDIETQEVVSEFPEGRVENNL